MPQNDKASVMKKQKRLTKQMAESEMEDDSLSKRRKMPTVSTSRKNPRRSSIKKGSRSKDQSVH